MPENPCSVRPLPTFFPSGTAALEASPSRVAGFSATTDGTRWSSSLPSRPIRSRSDPAVSGESGGRALLRSPVRVSISAAMTFQKDSCRPWCRISGHPVRSCPVTCFGTMDWHSRMRRSSFARDRISSSRGTGSRILPIRPSASVSITPSPQGWSPREGWSITRFRTARLSGKSRCAP